MPSPAPNEPWGCEMTDFSNADLQQLLRGVQELPCTYSRRAMLRTLRALAGRRLYISRKQLVAPDELAIALDLLGQMRVTEVRDALMVRLGCRKTKAYKLITLALEARRGALPATHANPRGLRQLALALDDQEGA